MLLLTAALLLSAEPRADRFSGGFIQLTNISAMDVATRLTRRQWGDVLQSMKHAGLTTVIVQYVRLTDGGRDYPLIRPGEPDDALGSILSEADGLNGMTVFVGLWNQYFGDEQFTEAFFKDARVKTATATKEAWTVINAQGGHRSFGGWYVALEPWNFPDDAARIKLFGDYLAETSSACKKLTNDKPVAFTSYFNPKGFATPGNTTKVYTQILKAAPDVGILLVQDGVGEKWNTAQDCQAYFGAYKAACGERVRLWADIESFTLIPDTKPERRIPADAGRFECQIASATGVTDTFVTFEFFHYMNPNRYTSAGGAEIAAMCAGGLVGPRRDLYDVYLRRFGFPPRPAR
jgi:hypothetical protein